MKVFIKVCSLLVILAVSFTLCDTFIKEYYNNHSLYGSFEYKLSRAEGIEENKTIVIGGSSTNLGFDSQLFESVTKKPAVNLSVSAGVPLRVYMRSAALVGREGDTIIMVLEYPYYSNDFYSIDEAYIDMIGIDGRLKCDDNFHGTIDYLYTYFLRTYARVNDSFMFWLKEYIQNDNTIYVANSVNSHGDFCLHENLDSSYVRKESYGIFSYDKEVFEEINDFIMEMKAKGIDVYLSFPPIDGKSYTNYEAYFEEIQCIIFDNINENNVLGLPFDFSFDENCFFDTMYHLKYEKKYDYTSLLASLYNNAS